MTTNPVSGKRLERLLKRLEWVGIVALLLMMATTTIDVIGAKLFKQNLHGALDIVMLAQVVAITFAAATTLWIGRHVSVEFFVTLLPAPLRAALDWVVELMGLGLFVLIVWQLFELGRSMQVGGDVSPTARIPLYPFVYAGALACAATLPVFAHRLLRPFRKGEP